MDGLTVRRSDGIAKFAEAMTRAQAELKNPPKESTNPHFRSKYADLATVRDAVVPVLARHGLAVMQLPCELHDAPALTTLVMHVSGEWVETTIKLRPSKTDPQGVGSALTYARRYALQSIAGVAAEDDDDGHAASQSAKHAAPAKATPSPASITGLSESAATAKTLVTRLQNAQIRDEAVLVWKDFERLSDTLATADRQWVRQAFAEFGKRLPKESPVQG